MKLRLLVAAMLTAGLVLGSTTASAKGAQQITVTGPGLAAPIRLANSPETVTSLNRIAEKAGLFEHPADRDLPGRPSGDLGPRYVATYDWLIAQDTTVSLRQDLYPFADGGAVAYTPPGQRVGGGGRPPGGWYRGGPELTMLLVAAGVPIPPSQVAPVPVVAPPVVTG
jgi:hypothetical protein